MYTLYFNIVTGLYSTYVYVYVQKLNVILFLISPGVIKIFSKGCMGNKQNIN